MKDDSSEAAPNDWVVVPTQILSRLDAREAAWTDRLTAVLFAETTAFDTEEQARLRPALFAFALENRFSTDDETITAVGAAIRKLAMILPASQLDEYARLFQPTATETLSFRVELELAKAIVWRLSQLTQEEIGKPALLEQQLSGLASDYLSPRLVLQENYASIVLQAVVAVALLQGSRQNELIDRIAEMNIDWFTDLLSRRLEEAAQRQESDAARASTLKSLCGRLRKSSKARDDAHAGMAPKQ